MSCGVAREPPHAEGAAQKMEKRKKKKKKTWTFHALPICVWKRPFLAPSMILDIDSILKLLPIYGRAWRAEPQYCLKLNTSAYWLA